MKAQQGRSSKQIGLDWVGVRRVKKIRSEHSYWIKEKQEYYIGLDR